MLLACKISLMIPLIRSVMSIRSTVFMVKVVLSRSIFQEIIKVSS